MPTYIKTQPNIEHYCPEREIVSNLRLERVSHSNKKKPVGTKRKNSSHSGRPFGYVSGRRHLRHHFHSFSKVLIGKLIDIDSLLLISISIC